MIFFLPASLLLGLVLILAQRLKESKALTFAFCAGIFLDLVSGRTLGLSSSFFLACSWATILLNNRFSFSNPLTRFFAALIFYLFFQLFFGKPFGIFEGLILSLMVTLFGFRKKEKIIL